MILKDNIKVIAFDADDTLWENQPYIPFHTTWQHEQAEEFDHPRLFRLERFEDLCGIL